MEDAKDKLLEDLHKKQEEMVQEVLSQLKYKTITEMNKDGIQLVIESSDIKISLEENPFTQMTTVKGNKDYKITLYKRVSIEEVNKEVEISIKPE